MNKAVVIGCGILAAAILVGCGGGGDDAVMKDSIALMNEMSAILEKATDAESAKKALEEVKKMESRGNELKKKIDAMSKEQKDALEKKYKAEGEAAANRLLKAGLAAGMKAGKLGP